MELANLVVEFTSSTSGIEYLPARDEDPQRRCPDISKIAKFSGWQPEIELREGVEKTINIPGGATAMLDVTANGSSAYRFSSHYSTADNPIVYTRQGQTIAFNLNGLAGSHPFVIQTSSGSTYVSGNHPAKSILFGS